MIEVTESHEAKIMGFRVEGGIEKSDIDRMAALFLERTQAGKSLRFYLDATDLRLDEISGRAVWEDLTTALRHPAMVANMEKFALISDENWLRRGFEADAALFPTMTGKAFASGETEAAKRWLRVDEAAPPQVPMNWNDLIRYATVKAVGGIAIGLLVAGYFGDKTRQRVGWAALLGAFAVGVPMWLQVLKGDRPAK